MCQLLGMNCNVPTDICFSFTGFQARGGLTDHHTDGWGITFFEGKGVRQFLDPNASAHSPVADFIRTYPIKSKNVIAHIRKATQGEIKLENTHPFVRELWGSYWSFAHNGDLKGYSPKLNGWFCPVGNTDSEKAFCYILQELKVAFGEHAPPYEKLAAKIHELTLELCSFGVFNFLLSNGEFMMAHCSNKLASIVRQAPFTVAHLKDQQVKIDFSSLTTSNDRVTVIATNPLTENEIWEIHEPGSLLMLKDGKIVGRFKTIAGIETKRD
ncbi:MAG TPA: class II glutamine amidotransferase [Bacteriovoracaceae bacterium]|nr:class II glutamine amidotransferase [Bacteriovoracaceae bacterium]